MADPDFEENVKGSFSRVRDHILLLEKEVRANRDSIIKQNEQIKFLLEHLSRQLSENEAKTPEISPNEAVSTGNMGVYSNIHSFTIHSFNSHSDGIHPIAILEGKDDIEEDLEAKDKDSEDDEAGEGALDEDDGDDNDDNDEPEEAPKYVPLVKAVPLSLIGEYLTGIAKAQIDEPKAKPKEEENAVPKPSSEPKKEAVPMPVKDEVPEAKTSLPERQKPAEDANKPNVPEDKTIKAEQAKAQEEPKAVHAKPADEPKPVQAKQVADEDKNPVIIEAKKESFSMEKNNYPMFHKRSQPQKIKSFATFQGLKREIEETFDRLSKQELLTFLTIYQLEDDIKNVSYTDVAEKLKLSEGCIRTYISALIRKGVPVEKKKFNNKLVLLFVPKEFRELNLKKQLMANYYRTDPYQPTLKESF